MKNSVFLGITPYSSLKINRRLGGTCRLHIQGPRISQAGNQREADIKQSNRLAEISGYVGEPEGKCTTRSEFPLARPQDRRNQQECKNKFPFPIGSPAQPSEPIGQPAWL
jgi:hypothetical protein